MTKSGSPKDPKTPIDRAKESRIDAEPSPAAGTLIEHDPSVEAPAPEDHATEIPAPAESSAEQDPTPDPGTSESALSTEEHSGERQEATEGDAPQVKPTVPPNASAPAGIVRGRSAAGTVALVLSILALISLSASAYYAWQQHQDRDERLAELRGEVQQLAQQAEQSAVQTQGGAGQLREIQRELARLRERPQDQELTDSLNQQIAALQQQFASFAREQNQQLGQMDDRLNGQQQRLLNMSTTNREDWLMAEAEYLLRLANQRVLIERSATSAVGLLESADAIMEQVAAGLGDPELFAIRRAIAQDLAALRLVRAVDKEGLYVQLQALADSVSRLPTAPEGGFRAGESAALDGDTTQQADAQPRTWYARAWNEVKSMAGVFDQYVRIQDTDTPARPLVDQASLQLAELNLRLALEQAQVAMLREQAGIYRLSLERVQQLVEDFYQAAPITTEFQQRLRSLAQVEVVPALPDISGSLQLLHGYIETLHRTRPQGEGQS